MAKNVLIPKDGKTRDGRFAGKFGIGPFAFKFRPALPERVYDWIKSDRSTGSLHMRETTKFILEHLKTWDIEEEDGTPAAVSKESLSRMPHTALEYIVDTICTYTEREEAAEIKNSDGAFA